MRRQFESVRTNLHKGLCGLLVALALVTLPLPAFADITPAAAPAEPSSVAAPATTSTTPVTPTPASAPTTSTETTTASPGLGLADSTQSAAPVLQTTPTSDTTAPTIALSATDSAATASTPTATARVENTVKSDATSGAATVADNRNADSATSGAATATATVINVANSNGATAGAFKTFECNVTDDTHDNLVIDPSSLLPICQSTNVGTTQPGASTAGLQTGASLTEILNNIALNALSGDASIERNRNAGDATSGNASAVANIVNIANTAISANNSFLGIINIYANLTGNILVPQSLVDGLVKSGGVVPTSGNSTTTIDNAIDASALSGNASVSDNRNAGDATSGGATTSLTVLNLTGQQVVAKNSLLVFVNVLGKWQGLIIPAPGSKTALLGSGIQGGQGTASDTTANLDVLGGDETTSITNNISVHAQSGNATVADNRNAGSATSGTAAAGVNLLNITNSNFKLDDWFGALFINVLGLWTGNFDVQATAAAGTPNPAIGNPADIVKGVQVFQFGSAGTVKPVTRASVRSNRSTGSFQTATSNVSAVSTPTGAVLGSATTNGDSKSHDSGQATHSPTFDIIALGAMVSAFALLIALGGAIIRRHYMA